MYGVRVILANLYQFLSCLRRDLRSGVILIEGHIHSFNRLLCLIGSTVSSPCLNSKSDFTGAWKTRYASHPTSYTASPSTNADRLLEWLRRIDYVFPSVFSPHIVVINFFIASERYFKKWISLCWIWTNNLKHFPVKSWDTQTL